MNSPALGWRAELQQRIALGRREIVRWSGSVQGRRQCRRMRSLIADWPTSDHVTTRPTSGFQSTSPHPTTMHS